MPKQNKVSDKKRRLKVGDTVQFNYVTGGEPASIGDFLHGRTFGRVLTVSEPRQIIGGRLWNGGKELLVEVESDRPRNPELVHIQDILKDGHDSYYKSLVLSNGSILKGKGKPQETIAVQKAAGWI